MFDPWQKLSVYNFKQKIQKNTSQNICKLISILMSEISIDLLSISKISGSQVSLKESAPNLSVLSV